MHMDVKHQKRLVPFGAKISKYRTINTKLNRTVIEAT